MPLYESVFIVRQDIPNTQVESLTAACTDIITKGGGKVTKTEQWGLRTLTYKIKKNRKGHYVHFNFDAPAPAVIEYERTLRINEDVLRYLTVKVDALEEGPSCMMRRPDDRDGMSDGYGEGRGGGFGGGAARAPRRSREDAVAMEG